ncbi:hypothetical protein [uncultured Clostridium sp.]|uniref:hypothetical protein n=1 Tax=uncultured Clostridium sp. TaxID=59620 RepID=UPI0025E3E1D9|nr:hypothetical protein [uncultured Clostridium sp.]
MATVKEIKTISKGIRLMSLEEVFAEFEPMIKQFAGQCSKEISTSNYEWCDYYQFGAQSLCEAYDEYKVEKGCFSTLLVYKLKGMKSIIKSNLFAQKRGGGCDEFTSLDDTENKDTIKTIKDASAYEEPGFIEFEDRELISWLLSKLSDNEKRTLNFMLGDRTSVEESTVIGISRMTIHRRKLKLKEKIKIILKQAG